MATRYPKIASLKTVDQFIAHCTALGIEIPISSPDDIDSANHPLNTPWRMAQKVVGNRWCIHPMEGWDANPDGTASAFTIRRWRRFGESGAKLIWGGEAAAVRADGRANPRQMMATNEHVDSLAALRRELVTTHQSSFGTSEDLVVGLQLTHSGRFSRPVNKKLEPRIAYHHPLLDRKFHIDPADDSVIWTDDQLDGLIGDYVQAAKTAQEAGFDFVDVKACHGYLLHEFLSARMRKGRYGGDLEGRSRLLRDIITAIQSSAPGLDIGVRLSVFDRPPYEPGDEVGQPMPYQDLLPYMFGFGANADNPLEIDLTEPLWLLNHLKSMNVAAVNLTCGSPYYNPHIQRPAIFPPSDGYLPPEDPLVGVARQIKYVAECKKMVSDLPLIGSGYSYLQDYLPAVAHAVVARNMVDAVGIGRMVLSYPKMPADSLTGKPLARKSICRTFSDCTTAPRNGLISGCYPLDAFYKELPEADFVTKIRTAD